MPVIDEGTQIAADGLRYPAGTGPTDVDAYNSRSVRVSGTPDDGEAPVWDDDLELWVPGAAGGAGAVASVDGRTGVVTLADLYAALSHTQAISTVTGLETALDAKAALNGGHKSARRTAGALTLNNTSWTTMPSITNDLVLNASAGDDIEVGFSGRWGAEAVIGMVDVHTLVSGSRVNSCASGAAVSNSDAGVMAWRGDDNIGTELVAVGGVISYTLQAGDISAGTVTLRLVYRTGTASNKTLGATQGIPLFWSAKNIRQEGL